MRLVSLIKQVRFAAAYARRMRAGRRAVMSHLASPDEVAVPMPTFVQLRVTNLCNLRCKMCGQWGDTGIYREKAGAAATDGRAEQQRIQDLIGLRRQMALADYVALLDEIAPSKPVISLFGGEPFLYPDVIPLIQEIKKRGLTLTIITNGWFLERHAREIVEAGVDTIAVSVDGPPALHDRIRGRESSFDRLSDGVRAVSEWRRRLGKVLPLQMAILPITELNADALGPAVSALRELPLELVNVGLRWFVPSEAGRQYEQVMQETFGVEGTSWRGFDFRWPGGPERTQQLASLTSALRTLRRGRLSQWIAGRPWTSFVPSVAPADVPAYFEQPERVFGHDLCPVAWYFAQVEPDGNVCFCGDFPDYFIGNVREAPFREAWEGAKAQAFRAKLAREPLPICARCCGSFVYGKWQRPHAVRATAVSPFAHAGRLGPTVPDA